MKRSRVRASLTTGSTWVAASVSMRTSFSLKTRASMVCTTRTPCSTPRSIKGTPRNDWYASSPASLYTELGELDTAAEWIQGTIKRVSSMDRKDLPHILIQLATLRARQDRMPEARQLFSQGIEAADRAGDLDLYANGWNRLGEEYLKRGELALAEPPLLEAYRIRKLNHLVMDVSYRSLGRLRLEQGDLTSAAALLDRAVELSGQAQGWIPTWDIYHYRGRVRMAQGRLREAMGDLRIAVRLARVWRWNTPPDDAARMGTEGWLELVHSALVEAGNRLYLETRD